MEWNPAAETIPVQFGSLLYDRFLKGFSGGNFPGIEIQCPTLVLFTPPYSYNLAVPEPR
jgi:hypothetical protein